MYQPLWENIFEETMLNSPLLRAKWVARALPRPNWSCLLGWRHLIFVIANWAAILVMLYIVVIIISLKIYMGNKEWLGDDVFAVHDRGERDTTITVQTRHSNWDTARRVRKGQNGLCEVGQPCIRRTSTRKESRKTAFGKSLGRCHRWRCNWQRPKPPWLRCRRKWVSSLRKG